MRALTRVPQQRPSSAPKPAFQTLLHGGSPPKSRAAMTGRRASRKEVWSTATQERPNASKVSAALLRRIVVQRFGVNQNSTEARYAQDSEFTAALGTRTSRQIDIHCNRNSKQAQHRQRVLLTPQRVPEGYSPKWISHDLIYESATGEVP